MRTDPRGRFVLYADDRIAIGAIGYVHVAFYRGTIDLPALQRDRAFHERLKAQHPKGTVVFTASKPNVGLPSSEVRKESVAMLKANRDRVYGTAVLVEGDGFWASAARSVATGVFQLAPPPYPVKIFARPDEAAAWIAGLGPGIDGGLALLREAIDEVRAHGA